MTSNRAEREGAGGCEDLARSEPGLAHRLAIYGAAGYGLPGVRRHLAAGAAARTTLGQVHHARVRSNATNDGYATVREAPTVRADTRTTVAHVT